MKISYSKTFELIAEVIFTNSSARNILKQNQSTSFKQRGVIISKRKKLSFDNYNKEH